MNSEELKKYILDKIGTKKDEPFKAIMIKTLMQNEGKATKDDILEELKRYNPDESLEDLSKSSVFEITLYVTVPTFPWKSSSLPTLSGTPFSLFTSTLIF